MRIRVQYQIPHPVPLPYSLNYALMSYLYRAIRSVNPDLADWLHHEGIRYQNRSYKPFVFSSLQFRKQKNTQSHRIVEGDAFWYVDSIRPDVIRTIYEGIRVLGALQILHHVFPLLSVQLLPQPDYQQVMNYQTLSPIVVPIQRRDQLVFCHPLESDFYDQIRTSLRRWAVMKWEDPSFEEAPIHIRLLDPASFDLKQASVLTKVKEKNLKGYQFPFQIEASPRIQEVAMEAGLGSYSSQGFGMVAVQPSTDRSSSNR
ncbi:CRISPR-associated endoribonuclease Cas6 [Thermoflavimicrobium dichotomicum]|uniref:CRISPR-associated endoribonuclease n=1 Tax=Thermoflavimicrobium dichotomicum TaxID=46223 RepID=A0A1I3T774_9BACL|nr:CRISPR-associated endoribonuclease Cas6 [Thermoflavimicrobium dichotomicum]SFJ66342.1 CRISPR-associated endoribonuclease Cas6 [Thermoflavimicrobium dichotomicum]